ncbi:MAG: alkaline phosphatase family protein [Bacteroidia bacterium]|nr:alkaline phosphatase family protein [Bacteroidia bacterium]
MSETIKTNFVADKFLQSVFVFFLVLFSSAVAFSQSERPKLVVVITIDQMRGDYLDRFKDKFGEDGFKRMLRDGFHYRNAHYSFMPTATGPGHSAIYSGAVPSVSGIIGNGWYSRELGKSINVVNGMDQYQTIGVPDSISGVGHAGPDNLLVTTIADELHMASQFRSKVVSVAIKDRAAIMGGGHTADGAFWFDAGHGRFVTSSFYAESLPNWVERFNTSGIIDRFNSNVWELSYPEEKYTVSREDDSQYESKMRGKKSPTFPYDLNEMNAGYVSYYSLIVTPFGSDMVEALAEKAITEEKLGQGDFVDYLAMGFSSTDYAGHQFGPYSIEIQDMYIKLDKTIAKMLKFLDKKVGEGNYTVALSSDHGVGAAPRYINSKNLPTGIYNTSALKSRINQLIKSKFGLNDIVLSGGYSQIYLDLEKITDGELYHDIIATVKTFLEGEDMVQSVYTRDEVHSFSGDLPHHVRLLQNGYHPQRSGDVFFIIKPSWLGQSGPITASHGSPYIYDTHVPIIMYGKGVPRGSSVRKVAVTDLAPTLSLMTGSAFPTGSRGVVLTEVFEE